LFYDLFSIDACYFLCLDAKKSNQRKIKDGMIAPRIRPGQRLPLCSFVYWWPDGCLFMIILRYFFFAQQL
jgi:hypothetical protein